MAISGDLWSSFVIIEEFIIRFAFAIEG